MPPTSRASTTEEVPAVTSYGQVIEYIAGEHHRTKTENVPRCATS